jgi:hypothetical protein
MKTEITSPLAATLAELSRLYPDLRFGQLIEMIVMLSGEETPIRADEVEDKPFAEAALRHMSLRRRQLGIEDGLPRDETMPGQRAELLDLVVQVSDRHPDWRVGCLIEHLAAGSGSSLYDAEDEQLIEGARRVLAG